MIYLTEENNFLFNQCHHNKLLLHLESVAQMHLFLYLLVFLLLLCLFVYLIVLWVFMTLRLPKCFMCFLKLQHVFLH